MAYETFLADLTRLRLVAYRAYHVSCFGNAKQWQACHEALLACQKLRVDNPHHVETQRLVMADRHTAATAPGEAVA